MVEGACRVAFDPGDGERFAPGLFYIVVNEFVGESPQESRLASSTSGDTQSYRRIVVFVGSIVYHFGLDVRRVVPSIVWAEVNGCHIFTVVCYVVEIRLIQKSNAVMLVSKAQEPFSIDYVNISYVQRRL